MRDEPIYLLTKNGEYRMYCYVIEEGNRKRKGDFVGDDDRRRTRSMTAALTKQNGDCIGDGKLTSKGDFIVVYETKPKTTSHDHDIRSLPLPINSFNISRSSLVVFNSFFYLFGGSDITIDENRIPQHSNLTPLRYFDMRNPEKGWQIRASSEPYYFTSVSPNGSIVRFECHPYPHALFKKSINSSTWQELPKLPKKLGHLIFLIPVILAITDTDIYWRITSNRTHTKTGYHTVYGVGFNLAKWEWYVFDNNNSFDGTWSQGVVFYDSYLFLFGGLPDMEVEVEDRTDDDYFPYVFSATLRVYDLKARKWLPYHHPFPTTDSNKYVDAAFPSSYTSLLVFRPSLFRVRHNKLAILWANYDTQVRELPESHTKKSVTFYPVYCTKFIIHKTDNSKTNGADQPPVYATLFSHGTYLVDGRVTNYALRVTGGESMVDEKEEDEEMIPAYG